MNGTESADPRPAAAEAPHAAARCRCGRSPARRINVRLLAGQIAEYASAVADGTLTIEQLRPQMPPETLAAVARLAGDLADIKKLRPRRERTETRPALDVQTPLVQTGPGGDFNTRYGADATGRIERR